MKNILILIFLIHIAIDIPQSIPNKGLLTLTIKITKLKNNKGYIALQIREAQGELIKELTSEITNNCCELIIEGLSPQIYSIRYYHDENSNKKLDTNWMGIPIEGYGFSNNASSRFGTPPISEREFELKENLTITLNPKY